MKKFKYIVPALGLLMCNEVLSLAILSLMAVMFLVDLLKGAPV